MNKKATSYIAPSTLMYTLISIAIFLAILFFIYLQMNGAKVWGEYYSRELANVINLAEPGDHYEFLVQDATKIAVKNEVRDLKNETFMFDNTQKEVCVKLSPGRKSCYNYFNDVNITNINLNLATQRGNVLVFDVQSAR